MVVIVAGEVEGLRERDSRQSTFALRNTCLQLHVLFVFRFGFVEGVDRWRPIHKFSIQRCVTVTKHFQRNVSHLLFTKSLIEAQIERVDLVEVFPLVLSCVALGHLLHLVRMELHRLQGYVARGRGGKRLLL